MFKQKLKTPTTIKRASLLAFLAVAMVASFIGAFSPAKKAEAATSSTINFQARLLSAAGNIVPDGQYNVEFKLYDASTAGTNVWTETRTGGNTVRVVNGYLTVNLGSVTAFGSINWDQELWLTMNIGGTAVSPSWDGEMSPRLKLTAVPYAFTAGKLVGGSGANTTTLNTGTPSGTNTISLPAESGTLCIQNSANCGFALSSGGSNYIQNQFASAQTTASYWISGTGRAGTALQAPIIDAATAGALGIGNTIATSINLNQDTTLASGKSLTLQGAFTMQPAANGTSAFNIKNQGGANLLTLDTTNSRLGFNLGGTTTPTYGGTAGIELKGGLRLSAGSAAYADDYITPLGGTVKSLINIVNYDPGAFNQLIAMGLPSTAASTSRVISILDARTVAHQPSIAVLSPNQNEIGGFSWDGSNTAFLVKNSSSSGSIVLNVNGVDQLSASTSAIALNQSTTITGGLTQSGGAVSLTGNAASSFTTSAGALTLTSAAAATWSTSAGALTVRAAGTNALNLNTAGAGTVAVGDTNSTTINIGRGSDIARTISIGNAGVTTAQAITIGSTGSTSTTTIQGGTGAGAIALTTGTNGTIGLTSAGTGDINLTSADAGQFTTGTGALTLTAGAASTWSTSAGNLTVQAATTNTLFLQTAGAGTVAVGDTNSTTINIGRGSDIARTINIGTAGVTTAQTITIGSTGSTSTTTIQGGTGATAIALTAGTNGSINATTTGTGNITLTSASKVIAKTSTNSATGFQVQNAGGTAILDVDTNAARIGINNVAPTVDLDVGPGTLSASQVVQVRVGDFLMQSQQGGANGLTALTSRGSNGNMTIDGAAGGGVYLSPFTTNNNYLAAGGGKVRVGSSVAPTATLDVTGTAKFTPATNGTGIFVIQNAAATNTIFNVDSTNNRVGINTATPATALDVVGVVQQTGMITSDTAGTDSTKWTKLGSCTITAQYGMCNTIFTIIGGNDGTDNDNTQATVTARVKQQNALGGAPYVDVMLTGVARGITKADIKGVTTVNNGTTTTVELWGRINQTYEHWTYTPILNTNGANIAPWIWTPVNGFSAALPTGTQTDATYGTTYADTLTVAPASNSTSAFSVLDASNGNMITVDSTNGRVIIGRDDGNNGADAKLYFGDTANAANPWIGEANGTDSDILQLQGKNGINFSVGTTQTNVFTINASGNVAFQNITGSTSGFSVLDSSANPLLTVDTSANKRVNISGTGSNFGGSRLTFGDGAFVYIGEYGTGDTDAMRIHGNEEIYLTTKYSATANLYIDGGTGEVGINTEAPTEALSVVGNANVVSTDGTKAYRWRTSGSQLDFEGGGANLYLSTWTNVGMTTSQKTHIVMQTDGQMLFNSIGAVSGTLRTLCIDNTTKSVKIGPSSTSCASSSARYKTNIQDMPTSMGLETINALRPVTYDYKNGSGNGEIGFIAEEVYKVLPQIVELDENGQPNAVNYEFLVANLTKGMQQQQVQINNLRQGLWSGGIVSNDSTFNGFVTFNKGVSFKGDATFDAKVGFNGKITYNPDAAGTIVIPRGKTSATIIFAQPYDQVPQITASSSDYVSLRVTDKSVNGFTVTMKYPFVSDVNIDWVATQVALPRQDGSNAPKVVIAP